MDYILTEKGEKLVEQFIDQCVEKKRKTIELVENVRIPTKEEILAELSDKTNENGLFYKLWGVEDFYSSYLMLSLLTNEDIIVKER